MFLPTNQVRIRAGNPYGMDKVHFISFDVRHFTADCITLVSNL